MVAELSALQQIINALTGLNGLPAVIVECAVTTIYTCNFPSFKHSEMVFDPLYSFGGLSNLFCDR